MRYPHFWLANNLHLFALSILASHLMFDSIWYGIFWLFLFLKVPKKILLFSSCLVLILPLTEQKPSIPNTCMIIQSSSDHSLCKDKASIEITGTFQVGDVIQLHGIVKEIEKNPNLFQFDYERYLKAKGIDYIFVDTNSVLLAHKTTLYEVREWVKVWIKDYPEKSKAYLYALILGDRSLFEEEVTENITSLGISHLFAISGLHVGFFTVLLERVLPESRVKSWIVRLFLLLFLIVAGWSVSIMRAVSLYFVMIEVKRFGYTALDAFSMVFILFYLLNPYVLYDVAFQLSFGVTVTLLIGSDFIKGKTLEQLFWVSVIANVATIPILVQFNHAVQPLSVLLNVFFVWLVSTILFPMVTLTLLIPELVLVTERFLPFFEQLLKLDISQFVISVPHFHPLAVVLYYATFLSSKRFGWLIVLVLQITIGGNWAKEDLILFDVGQGNALLLNEECSLLFDTGTSFATERVLIPYFEATGMKELDYLMVSHGDFDHAGGVRLLFETLTIHHFVISEESSSTELFHLSEYAKELKIPVLKVRPGDQICGLKILEPSKTGSDNNESIVAMLDERLRVLLLADSELKKSYGSVDVLMLGHHGSRTSNTEQMIASMKPKIAVISVGRNNTYGLPNQDVLKLVEDIPVFRTDFDGNLYYDFDEVRIRKSEEVVDEIYRSLWYTTR